MTYARYAGDLFKSRTTLYYLFLREFRARYRYTHLGWLWAVIQPIALMTILSAVFTVFTPVKTASPYPVFSLLNLSVWMFLSGSLTGCVQSLLSNGSLLKKVYFPRMIVPAAVVFGSAIDFGAMLLAVACALAIWRVHLPATALLLGAAIAWQTIFCLSLGTAASMLAVHFRDLRHLIGVALQVWMFASPVLYPVDAVPVPYRSLYMLNPMAGILCFYEDIVLRGAVIHWSQIAISMAMTVLVAVLAAVYFIRYDRTCIDFL